MVFSKYTTFSSHAEPPTLFKRLRLRLTALCLGVTCLVIAVLTVICLLISESGMRSQEYTSFVNNLNNLYQNFELQTSLSHKWLRQMEYRCQVLLRITDNGKPLLFESLADKNSEESTATHALFENAANIAASEHGIDVNSTQPSLFLKRHAEFTMKDESGNLCYASAALFPLSGGSVGILALHPLTLMQAGMLRQRLAFFLADLAAAALLAVFFWHFTAKILRPLEENRRKQMQFVASASHELRSPLTVILTNTAAVKDGVMPNDAQYLATVESEGRRMSRLITDMLQLAGADNRSWSIQPADTELDTLLLRVWENYEPQAISRQLHWEIRLPDDAVPPCVCDAERIRQLLGILIDNAFSYTPAHGTVRLSLACTGPEFQITVSDNGPGIPDDQKEAVFERFYRADPARKAKSHFGLGLCIAKEIALLHRGQLLLLDTPGGGATFQLKLPGAANLRSSFL